MKEFKRLTRFFGNMDEFPHGLVKFCHLSKVFNIQQKRELLQPGFCDLFSTVIE